jgi:hypothetical protein
MKAARDQKATPGFNAATGTAGEGYSRGANKYAKNQWSGHSNDGRLVNFGRGSTKGNDGSCGHSGMPMTGMKPPTSGVPSVPAQGSVRDNINRGSQVRTPGGTRAWDPKGTQNYKGNIDSIDCGRGPTKGNMQ